MQLPRFIGLVDLGILTVVAVALLLPEREMFASTAFKGDAAKQSTLQFTLALAEARTIAKPDDGRAVEAFARQLGDVGFKDWAIEAAIAGSERAKQSPTRWRALLAASVAYVDRLDVIPALDFANRALSACDSTREAGDQAACPTWEEVRMQLYQQHLDAGVKSGIDPHHNPLGFRRAGEAALRSIRLNTQVHDRPPEGSGQKAPSGSQNASGSTSSDAVKTAP